jgi:hypothetical protein
MEANQKQAKTQSMHAYQQTFDESSQHTSTYSSHSTSILRSQMKKQEKTDKANAEWTKKVDNGRSWKLNL